MRHPCPAASKIGWHFANFSWNNFLRMLSFRNYISWWERTGSNWNEQREGAVFIMIKISLHSLSYNSFSPSFNIEISIKKSKHTGWVNSFRGMLEFLWFGSRCPLSWVNPSRHLDQDSGPVIWKRSGHSSVFQETFFRDACPMVASFLLIQIDGVAGSSLHSFY